MQILVGKSFVDKILYYQSYETILEVTQQSVLQIIYTLTIYVRTLKKRHGGQNDSKDNITC